MKIAFMGTPAAAAVALKRLIEDGHEIAAVYTQPDRPSGRGNRIVFSPVKELALSEGLTLRQPTSLRTPEASSEFKSIGADIAVVVAYGRILPDDFLNAFPKGAVNLHFSLLPKYRGAAPVNWAIVNGERVTGVTTIQMDSGLDTGDILLARETPIGESETAPQLMDRLADLGADVLSETIGRFDEILPVPQDNEASSLAPIMKREDGLIDWNAPAGEISNRVRGFQPFPGSYTFLDGRKVVVWSAQPCEYNETASTVPGLVVSTEGDRITVAAGEGTFLSINEIQFEGRRRMSAKDALNGAPLGAGDRFSGSRPSSSTAA